MKRKLGYLLGTLALTNLGLVGFAASSSAAPATPQQEERACASSPAQPSWCMDWINDDCDTDTDCGGIE